MNVWEEVNIFLALFGTGKQGAVYGEISEKSGDGTTYVNV